MSKSTEPETGFPTLSSNVCTQMIAFAVEPSVTAGTSFEACMTARNALVVDFWAIRPNELNSNRPAQITVFFIADLSPSFQLELSAYHPRRGCGLMKSNKLPLVTP